MQLVRCYNSKNKLLQNVIMKFKVQNIPFLLLNDPFYFSDIP